MNLRKLTSLNFLLEKLAFYYYTKRSLITQKYSTLLFLLKCKLNVVSVGIGSNVWGNVFFHKYPGSTICIGDRVWIVSDPRRYNNNVFPQSKLRTMSPTAQIKIGNGVGFNSISITARSKTITIGDETLIGGNCQIMDSDMHPPWPPEARWNYPGDQHDEHVNIGSRVFIGQDVLILKGVSIGNNSVIAAGSVVSRSIPENCLAGGVPAKVIKSFL